MPAALGGDPPVAIRAANLAPFDLGVEGREAVSEPREARDVPALRSNVIEIEDKRIVLVAVDAQLRCSTAWI